MMTTTMTAALSQRCQNGNQSSWCLLLFVLSLLTTSAVVVPSALAFHSSSTVTPACRVGRPQQQQQQRQQQQQPMFCHRHRLPSSSSSSSSSSASLSTTRLYYSGEEDAAVESSSISNDEDDGNDNNSNDNHQSTNVSVSVSGGTATITQEVINLVKAIVGAGVLTLPSGIAAYGNAPSAVLPALALIVLLGMISSYGFVLIGRVCSMTQSTSFQQAWSKTINPGTNWIPTWSVTIKTCFACLAYSMILGDTFQSLLWSTLGVQWSRTTSLLAVTGTILLPLCLLRNLSSLAPFSLVGTCGMMYTAMMMTIRYVTKSYVPGGKYATDVPLALRPHFGTTGASAVMSTQTTILISMLSVAYLAHFNAPKFYNELHNNTIPRFTKVVTSSFGISILLTALMTSVGYLTFGASCSGLILNNYSTRDVAMSFSRAAVAVSLVFSFPLAFVGAREGVLDLFNKKKTVDNDATTTTTTTTIKKQSSFRSHALVTVSMLSAITGAAIVAPDVSLVLALAGATLGNALTYVYPALMFRGAINRKQNATPEAVTTLQKVEVKASMAMAVLGVMLGALGTVTAVRKAL